MAVFWGDRFNMPKPDQFEVRAVRVDGYVYEHFGTYETRGEAQQAVNGMDRAKYRIIAIEPQVKALRPFQTHAGQIVWEG